MKVQYLVAAMAAAVVVIGLVPEALAASDPFSPLATKAETAQTELDKILSTVGVLGFIAVCAFAIFSRGKFPWGWAAAIAGGFLLVGMAPTLISWLKETTSTSSLTPSAEVHLAAEHRSGRDLAASAGGSRWPISV